MGLDLINGAVRDNKKAGVLEPAVSKIKSLKFATEAAITILRIDDMIKLAPEKSEEGSYGDAAARGELWKDMFYHGINCCSVLLQLAVSQAHTWED